VKPPTYSPANIDPILEVQREQLPTERLSVHDAAGVSQSS
jgi:hypothetical protein